MTAPQSETKASLASYDISALMTQTRLLAADYRQQTGQALPVTEELARFDAISLLALEKVTDIDGIDAYNRNEIKACDKEADDSNAAGDEKRYYLIKGRVIFKGGKARQKLGKLSLKSPWHELLMVIYDADYQPCSIFKVSRDIINQELSSLAKDKRGSMTVAKYKAIGKMVWQSAPENQSI